MPKYIDADALLAELQEEIDFETSMYTKEQNEYFKMGLKCAFRDVKNQPTADVVPRAEVDKWYHEYHAIKDELKQEKMYHRETEKLADKYFNGLQAAKSEVAREIFEEIERNIYGIETPYNILQCIPEGLIAELKKKYTEEQ